MDLGGAAPPRAGTREWARRTRLDAGLPQAAAPLHLGRRSVDGDDRKRRPEGAHGGGDSGVPRASWHANLGEDGEETTAEFSVGVDSSGEAQSGIEARRRQRQPPASREKEKGG